MQNGPRSLQFSLAPDEELTTSHPHLQEFSPDERENIARAYAAFRSRIDENAVIGPDRWSISFFVGYSSSGGWSFGMKFEVLF